MNTQLQITSQLIDTEQAASCLCLKPATLAQMRWRNDKRLPWVKLGKAVRYKMVDVQAFIDSNTING